MKPQRLYYFVGNWQIISKQQYAVHIELQKNEEPDRAENYKKKPVMNGFDLHMIVIQMLFICNSCS